MCRRQRAYDSVGECCRSFSTGNRQPAHLIRRDVNERGNSWLVNAEWGCWHSCATARMRVASCRHAFDKLCAVSAAVSAACGLLHWACCVRNDSGTSSASITMLHKAIDSLFLETRERGDGYRVTALSPDHASTPPQHRLQCLASALAARRVLLGLQEATVDEFVGEVRCEPRCGMKRLPGAMRHERGCRRRGICPFPCGLRFTPGIARDRPNRALRLLSCIATEPAWCIDLKAKPCQDEPRCAPTELCSFRLHPCYTLRRPLQYGGSLDGVRGLAGHPSLRRGRRGGGRTGSRRRRYCAPPSWQDSVL